MTVRFSKLHGTGNDFLVTVALADSPAPHAALARALCDRHRGVGADGLITLLPGADGADCAMELRNADGAVAEMSGNGVRCLAWVAVREGLAHDDELVVDTGGGRRTVALWMVDDELRGASVDMGPVTFDPARIPLDAPSAFDLEATFHGVTYHGDAAGVGNPHLVLLVDDVSTARVTQHGPRLEVDERFPNRTNVEFVSPSPRGGIDMRVWERGVGETLSCGTGACAAAAVAHRRGMVDEQVIVHVRGGDLTIGLGDTVQLGGEVQHVFDAEIDELELVRRLA
jgi:diaminopimelate epimerase